MGTFRPYGGLILWAGIILICSNAAVGRILETTNCTQSSVAYAGHCGRALDGSTDRNFAKKSCTYTQQQIRPWWQTTLKSNSRVKAVRIYNRGDCCASRLNNFVIMVDGVVCAVYNSAKDFDVKKFSCNRDGTVVRIESRQPGKSILTLCEVQLIGWQVLPPGSCKHDEAQLVARLKASKDQVKQGIRYARASLRVAVNSLGQQKIKAMPLSLTCENYVTTISCPTNYNVRVLRALYGRQSTQHCPKGHLSTVIRCAARNAKSTVKSRCADRQSCQVPATNGVFGDPCIGTYKYLEVEYQCLLKASVEATRLSDARNRYQLAKKQLKERFRNDKMSLRAKIVVGKRLYMECLSKMACQSDKRLKLLLAISVQKKDYQADLAKAKQLESFQRAELYKQAVMNKPLTKTCEHDRQSLSCPSGYAIRVLSAFYGRKDAKSCPHKSIWTTNCRASKAQDRVEAECSGKQDCIIHASNSVFGDPCHGTHKYMELAYVCEIKPENLKAARESIKARLYSTISQWGKRHSAAVEALETQLKKADAEYKRCVTERRNARSFSTELRESTKLLRTRLSTLKSLLVEKEGRNKQSLAQCQRKQLLQEKLLKISLMSNQGEAAKQSKLYKKLKNLYRKRKALRLNMEARKTGRIHHKATKKTRRRQHKATGKTRRHQHKATRTTSRGQSYKTTKNTRRGERKTTKKATIIRHRKPIRNTGKGQSHKAILNAKRRQRKATRKAARRLHKTTSKTKELQRKVKRQHQRTSEKNSQKKESKVKLGKRWQNKQQKRNIVPKRIHQCRPVLWGAQRKFPLRKSNEYKQRGSKRSVRRQNRRSRRGKRRQRRTARRVPRRKNRRASRRAAKRQRKSLNRRRRGSKRSVRRQNRRSRRGKRRQRRTARRVQRRLEVFGQECFFIVFQSEVVSFARSVISAVHNYGMHETERLIFGTSEGIVGDGDGDALPTFMRAALLPHKVCLPANSEKLVLLRGLRKAVENLTNSVDNRRAELEANGLKTISASNSRSKKAHGIAKGVASKTQCAVKRVARKARRARRISKKTQNKARWTRRTSRMARIEAKQYFSKTGRIAWKARMAAKKTRRTGGKTRRTARKTRKAAKRYFSTTQRAAKRLAKKTRRIARKAQRTARKTQRAAKKTQRSAKRTQRSAKRTQRASKKAQRSAKRTQRSAKKAQRSAKRTQRSAKRTQRAAKKAQKATIMQQRAPEGVSMKTGAARRDSKTVLSKGRV